MQLINSTGMVAGYTLGVEPSGRERLVVVVKGTFHLPAAGEHPTLLAEQVPLITADTFTGEPGFSAPNDEVDFAPRKHRCDVLVNGSAWAPGGRPVERVVVGVRIGDWKKAFAVVGDRHWKSGLGGIRATAPAPFTRTAISYDVAFGGVDAFHEDPAEYRAFMSNPVGRGWHYHLKGKYLDGTPLPNTEELDRVVAKPDGDYAPMALGPLGRGWSSRLEHAGTYDQNWIDNVFPFLPADFSEEYYQAAPRDQQISPPRGGEEVTLVNLTQTGHLTFHLPDTTMPVVFFRRDGGRDDTRAPLDTIVLQPDKGLFTMAWRASVPLKRTIFEISEVLVGTQSRGWWRARELGKTWYPSLNHFIRKNEPETTEEPA